MAVVARLAIIRLPLLVAASGAWLSKGKSEAKFERSICFLLVQRGFYDPFMCAFVFLAPHAERKQQDGFQHPHRSHHHLRRRYPASSPVEFLALVAAFSRMAMQSKQCA